MIKTAVAAQQAAAVTRRKSMWRREVSIVARPEVRCAMPTMVPHER
jgi:hypothetical protein